jgi:hypothetical protein
MKLICSILFLLLLDMSLYAQSNHASREGDFSFVSTAELRASYAPAAVLLSDSSDTKAIDPSGMQRLKAIQLLNAALAKNSRVVFVAPAISKLDYSITSHQNAKVVSLPRFSTNVLLIDTSKSTVSAPALVTFTIQ